MLPAPTTQLCRSRSLFSLLNARKLYVPDYNVSLFLSVPLDGRNPACCTVAIRKQAFSEIVKHCAVHEYSCTILFALSVSIYRTKCGSPRETPCYNSYLLIKLSILFLVRANDKHTLISPISQLDRLCHFDVRSYARFAKNLE